MQSYLQQSFAADNPNQDQIDDYNNKKDLIDAQKDLLTSQKALIDVMYPVISNLGKSGTITKGTSNIDPFHATTQTYQALHTAAEKVCSAIEIKDSEKVLLISEGDGVAVAQFKIINEQLKIINVKLAEEKNRDANIPRTLAVGTVLYSLAALSNSLASFTKIFRTDREFSSEVVEISAGDWESMLAGKCNKKLDTATTLDAYLINQPSNFLKTFHEVMTNKAVLENDKSKADMLKELSPSLTKLNELISNETSLKKILRSEYLVGKVKTTPSVLTTKVIKAIGFNMKTSNIWRSDKLYASGSVVVSYSIADSKGNLTDGGLIVEETELLEVQKSP